MTPSPADRAKSAAATRALEQIRDGMRIGLGTGSTAACFVRLLGAKVRQGLQVTGVATSQATAELATAEGITLGELDAVGPLDLTVDGADEVDPGLGLIKGGGGALLREKIVAQASARLLIVADEGKRVAHLGAFPLPVEIVRFGAGTTQAAVEALLARSDVDRRTVTLRAGAGGPVVTDEGHFVLDLDLGRIGDPAALAAQVNAIPGVVEHGLFLGMAEAAIFGRPDGSTEVLGRVGREEGLGEVPGIADLDELMRNLDA